MITLTANTVSLITSALSYDRVVRLFIDGTVLVRLSFARADLVETSTEGYGCYGFVSVFIPAGQKLYGISTGTPNISWAPTSMVSSTDTVRLV